MEELFANSPVYKGSMLENSRDSKKPNWQQPLARMGEVDIYLPFFSHLGYTVHGHTTHEIHQRRWLKVGNVMKGTSLYLAKTVSDNITSSSVAMKTNLFSS